MGQGLGELWDVLWAPAAFPAAVEVEDIAQQHFHRKAQDFPSTENQDKAPECVKNALIKDLIFKGKNSINDLI